MRADFALDYDVITVERAEKLYLMARFASGPAPGDKHRRPLNISLVIDRSGSMAGEKIDYTRQAAQFLVQHLGADDTLSIVLYNDKVETLTPPERITNKDAIMQLIERIRVRGTTNLSGGWLAGANHVASNLSERNLNRVLLMTDGLANRGITDVEHLIKLAQQKRSEGITTTTMGLGDEFNEDLLMEMANAGGGAYYFIESPEVTPSIFDEELKGLLSVVGQNLTIHVEPQRHVTSVRQLNGYPTTSENRNWQFRLGDIFGNEVKTLVLELTIPTIDEPGEQEIAVLRFEYDEITDSGTEHHVKEMPVMIQVSSDPDVPRIADTEVETKVMLLKAAQARQEAVKEADRGNYSQASQKLRTIAEEIGDLRVITPELKEERAALLAQAQQMEDGEQRYTEYNRKTMATQAFYTLTDRHSDTVMLRKREIQREGGDPDFFAIYATGVDPKPGVTPTHVSWNEKTFELTGDLIRMGRAQHNEVVIPERGVSRFHCAIRREGNKLILEDLDSTNGTSYMGRPLKTSHVLNVGDEVYLSDERLVFHEGTINLPPRSLPEAGRKPTVPEPTIPENPTSNNPTTID